MIISSAHLSVLLDSKYRQKTIDKCLSVLQRHIRKFDAIAISGYSMSLISPIVADRLNKKMIIVRKDEEMGKCASFYQVEGTKCKRYIIIDDLVSEKNTFKRIVNTIKESYDFGPTCKCVGLYLYMTEQSVIKNNDTCKRILGVPLLT